MGKVHPKVDEAIETLNMRDNPTRRRLLEGAGLVSAAGAASALLAACSSSTTTHAAVASNGKNPFPTVPNQKYYFVNHVTTNQFFTPTKYGFADATTLLGIQTPVWSGSTTSAVNEMISAINTGVSAKAAGIATTVIDPHAFTTPVKNAMDAGIPVISYNADGIYNHGVPEIGTNRLAYVGQALFLSGQAMGNQIKTLVPGGGQIAIFIATPGTGNIQPRYDGAVSVLGSSYKVSEIATGTVDSAELSAEKAYMLGHKSSLKGAFAVDSGSTANLSAALKGAGLSIPAGGFDTDPRTLSGLQAGTLKFSIFQDPYLQGFLPALYLYLYNLSGGQLAPPNTDTGLTVLTPDNVSQFTKPSRFQGASSAYAYLPRPSGPINQPQATTSV
ncbi:MAG TPA: substrate-binding domain-containing protein [Trebonia sp.]|jgi:simple sugar transport system substrate-binding protein